MAYLKKKRIKGQEYWYLVESYRQKGKVKTRTLKYLGREIPGEYQGLLPDAGSLKAGTKAVKRKGRRKRYRQLSLFEMPAGSAGHSGGS